jgi:hypothetical protein
MDQQGRLAPVAFDLETEGFLTSDEITVAGLRLPMGALVLLNTGGRSVDSALETRVQAESGLDAVKLVVCDSEQELLERLGEEADATLHGSDRLLVAFNGETWRGGFDLAFLRTRCGATDVRWPFLDVPYADLLPIVQKRVNTTIEGEDGTEEVGDLCGAFDVLIGGEHCDPFDDSSQAVEAAATGDWEGLVLHNIADIERTQQLAEWMERVVPKSEFKLKNLAPPGGARR